MVTKLALVNPNIAFKLSDGEKIILQTSGNGDLKSIVYNIYGKDIADGIINLSYEYEGIKLNGIVRKTRNSSL